MPYAENKSLEEYGDLHSQHHSDVDRLAKDTAQTAALEEEPPKLVVIDGPGNLYRIKWTHGNAEIPKKCMGDWNHKGKAQEAINGCVAQLRMDANARKVLEQAEAEERALHDKEVAEETARIQAEAKAQADAQPEVVVTKKKAVARKGK